MQVYHNNADNISIECYIHSSSRHQIDKITPTMPETRIIIHPQMRNIDLLSNLPGLLDQTAQLRALYAIWDRMDDRAELSTVVVG